MIRISLYICFAVSIISSRATAQSFPLFELSAFDTLKVYESMEEALQSPNEVICLKLKRKKLTSIPKEVFQFKNLQYLDLSKNKLDTFPTELTQLSQLQVLVLSKNEIEYITEDIGALKNLIRLQAGENQIWEVSKEIGSLTKLQYLDLWGNNLNILPYSIKGLNALKELDMRVNPVKQETQVELQGYLPEATLHFSYDCKCFD